MGAPIYAEVASIKLFPTSKLLLADVANLKMKSLAGHDFPAIKLGILLESGR